MRERTIYTVAGLNRYIRAVMEDDPQLRAVMVRGEVSGCKYHTSGHIYFTLKDADSAISCVMFAGDARRGLSFVLKTGQQVLVFGSIGVYERDGKYQLYARQIRPDGQGNLYLQYEALKAKLGAMGYFDADHKKAIPKWPKKVGIVTAATGAALQDILNIARRRNPYVQMVLCSAIVQGPEAPPSIVRAIRTLDGYGVDTIIVGRGGGSMEDLWAFNDPDVAGAIYECGTPVISAVGHETDVTIADFTADLRAPTPSAAAELAIPDARELFETCGIYSERLQMLLIGKLSRKRHDLEQLKQRLAHAGPMGRMREMRLRLMGIEDRLQIRMESTLEAKRHRLGLLGERLEGLSPLARLAMGCAYVRNHQGQVIRSVSQAQIGDRLQISLSDGRIEAAVTQITGKETPDTDG